MVNVCVLVHKRENKQNLDKSENNAVGLCFFLFGNFLLLLLLLPSVSGRAQYVHRIYLFIYQLNNLCKMMFRMLHV